MLSSCQIDFVQLVQMSLSHILLQIGIQFVFFLETLDKTIYDSIKHMGALRKLAMLDLF